MGGKVVMMRLLRANLARLQKNQMFRIGVVITAAMGIICPTIGAQIERELVRLTNALLGQYVENLWIDYFFFRWVLFVIFLFALCCSLYISTEYSDGTLRNKITAGYSRADIYLATFVTTAVAGCAMYSAWLIPQLCVGIPHLGFFHLFSTEEVAAYVLYLYAIMIAFAAIHTFLAMLVSNPTISVILCLGIVVILFLIPTIQTGNLQWKEFWPEEWNYAGMTYAAGSRCPFYVGGIRRSLSVFLIEFLPGGPAAQFYSLYYLIESDNYYLNPYVMFCGAAFFVIIPNIIGIRLFGHKELK